MRRPWLGPAAPQWDRSVPSPKAVSLGEFTRARGTFHRMAATGAVLAPLCGLKNVTFPPRLETVHALIALWRVRVKLFGEAGLPIAQKPFDAAYLANCPPLAFARDRSGRRPCKRSRICPFCYALDVEILYENVLRAINRLDSPPKLFLCVQRQFGRPENLDGLLRELGDKVPTGRGRIQHANVSVGNQPGTLAIRHAAIVADPTGWLPGDHWEIRLKPFELAQAVAWLAPYPVHYLCGDV